jgi:hypothetical protein
MPAQDGFAITTTQHNTNIILANSATFFMLIPPVVRI